MNNIMSRLLTETSPFFKKAQIAVAAILVICYALHAYIPANILADIIKYGITIIVLSEFTVKDGAVLAQDGFTLKALTDMIQAFPDQLQEIKDSLAGKLDLDQAKVIAGLAANATPAQVTDAAPAADATNAVPPAPAQATA